MVFDFYAFITNPFILMFVTVITGLLFGKIKFGKFNFATSGTLFTGLLIGWFIYKLGIKVIENAEIAIGYDTFAKMIDDGVINNSFFDTALIFFVASVGLLAAKDIGVVFKTYGKKLILIGILITFVGAGATYVTAIITPGINSYEIAGVYTGALTSSPGLGAALETAEKEAHETIAEYNELNKEQKKDIISVIDDKNINDTKTLTEEDNNTYVSNAVASVGIGHAIGYPFGVMVVIFAMNFLPVIFKMNIKEEKQIYLEEMCVAQKLEQRKRNITTTNFSIISFVTTCVVGYFVGSINIPIGSYSTFSLGSTGGILIVGLILGYIGEIGPLSFRMNPKILTIIREISLSFFLAIVGLKYGYMTFDALFSSGIVLVAASTAIGVLAIMSGYYFGRYFFKLNWVILSGVLCGGMTSTPGLGAAIDALDSDEPTTGYGASYPFALLTMIIFTIILHKLPM